MGAYLNDFIDFFGLSAFFDGTVLTVQEILGYSIVAFLGGIFTLIGVRCVFELIKIVTDWSRFR